MPSGCEKIYFTHNFSLSARLVRVMFGVGGAWLCAEAAWRVAFSGAGR